MNLVYKTIHAFAVPLFKNCYNIKVNNPEKLIKGPAIIAANQQSHLDCAIILAGLQNILKREIHFVSKHPSTYWHSFLGRCLGKYAAEPFLNAGDHITLLSNYITGKQLRNISGFFDKGHYLGIFPEGVTNNTGKIRKFQRGASMISRLTQTPIIPMYINWNASRTNPKLPLGGDVYLTLGDPIFPTTNIIQNGEEDSRLTLILKESVEKLQSDFLANLK